MWINKNSVDPDKQASLPADLDLHNCFKEDLDLFFF